MKTMRDDIVRAIDILDGLDSEYSREECIDYLNTLLDQLCQNCKNFNIITPDQCSITECEFEGKEETD